MKSIGTLFLKITFIAFLFFYGNSSFANKNLSSDICNEFDITREMVLANEKCPLYLSSQDAKQLNCSSYQQTTNYTCGPAAVMMLMNYYGMLNSNTLNQQTEMRISNEMGAVAGVSGGTSLSQVCEWLRNHGFNVSSGERVNSNMLINNIDHGVLTIIAFNNHWLIAKGYVRANKNRYQNTDEIIFADSVSGVRVISRDVIDTMWQSSQIYRKNCANTGEYIVATPKR